jgi:hypothetical protein
LYSTGFSSTGTELPGGVHDGNWTLLSTPTAPSGPAVSPFVTTGYFAPPLSFLDFGAFTKGWIANSSGSEWISPLINENAASLSGNYTYQQTFTLDSYFSTAVIIGQWAVDNAGYILVNGQQVNTGISGFLPTTATGKFGVFTPFVLDSSNTDFVQGLNTIEFVAYNNTAGSPNITGVDIDIESTFVVPEPATLVLFGLGLPAVLVRARKLSQRC